MFCLQFKCYQHEGCFFLLKKQKSNEKTEKEDTVRVILNEHVTERKCN